MFDEKTFVTDLLRKYYTKKEVHPKHLDQREFGVGNFESKIAARHLSFNTELKFKEFLIKNAPLNVSYSPAYYKYPDARPMEAKGFVGAELVFDLDVTDMNLSCQQVHGKQWVCENCLSVVKSEAIKLVEQFLVPDFGFSEKEIVINFSGNRGYHLHIDNEQVMSLGPQARQQIINYISGNGIDFARFFPTAGRRGTMLTGPKPTDYGWGGKIAQNVIKSLNSGVESLMNLGIDRKSAAILYKKRVLMEMGIRSGNWDMVYLKKKEEFWANVVKNQAIAQSDRIDKGVTGDVTHLIRLPNTIHGNTGLMAKKVGTKSELEKFNPLTDAIIFKKGELKLKAENVPAFVMNSKNFGPFKSEEVTLPKYAGLYLYLKGYATLLEYME